MSNPCATTRELNNLAIRAIKVENQLNERINDLRADLFKRLDGLEAEIAKLKMEANASKEGKLNVWIEDRNRQ